LTPHATHTVRGAIATAAALLVTACGGGGIDPDSSATAPPPLTGADCSQTRLKQSVLDSTREWYLFAELLPATIDPAQYSTAGQLLDALTATARAQSRDRFFSYVTGIAEENRLLSGASVGFGVTLIERSSPARLFVGQSFEGSAAAEAGLVRGDEILAIGTSSATLRTIPELAATSGGINEALGPANAGETRVLRWRNAAGAITERSITKREFAVNAVPSSSVRVLTAANGTLVGHLTLRSFVADSTTSGQPADLAALRAAFQQFASQGVRNLVIDLRYNGGGLVPIAELLLNLIAGDQVGQVSYATRLNSRQVSSQETRRFVRQPQTVPTVRVAFLVTERSASASELVVNSTVPYVQTAVVGARTFGKPVGQSAFDLSACDFRLRLVTFKSVNRNDDGDYFTGLPYAGYTRVGGAACAAVDDLARASGDPQEAMTAAALAWITSPTGACPGPAIAVEPDKSVATAAAAAKAAPPPIELPGVHEYLPATY
jgi:C-terminal processing protease CtpA/Prc